MRGGVTWAAAALVAVLAALRPPAASAAYSIGVGIADVTGPPTEISFMGYGQMRQKGIGLHLRQFSRAFIIDDGTNRLVYVSVDCGMIGNGLRKEVIEVLKSYYNDLYTVQNVMISGTHTHSTPGGFLMDMLFDLNTLGFVKETFMALLEGIVRSVRRAHNNMRPGRAFVATGELLGVSVNRSPTAYLANPESERSKYKYNTDKEMTQMKFVDMNGKPIGCINWYPVHATSMNNTNLLVSSDNLGYAAITLEGLLNPSGSLPGKGPVVCAFSTANEGDASPNTREPRCQLSGEPCEPHTSTCPKARDQCVAAGPGVDMFDSTRIIAGRLVEKARELLRSKDAVEITGPIHYIHQWVNMPEERVSYLDPATKETKTLKGCSPAMGYSFAAGTTDGPGAFSFHQGTTTVNPLWNVVRDFLSEPTKEDIECHGAKPILLHTGSMTFPVEWQPFIVSTQLARIGDLVITCVPGEFTTMSGRRMRNAVRDALLATGSPESTQVVITGLCNTYSDYVATPEEYQVQRYEGASTIFGPHTLTIYLAHYRRLAEALDSDPKGRSPGPEAPDPMNDLISLQTPVFYDSAPWDKDFGDVVEQSHETARAGDVVRCVFVSASPRNKLYHGQSYCIVDRLDEKINMWKIYKTDAHWETKFIWERKSTFFGTSEATCSWEVSPDTPPGTYRIRHFCTSKNWFSGEKKDHVGVCEKITVLASAPYRYGSGRRTRSLT